MERSFPIARPEVESLKAYSAPLEGRRGLLRLDFNENTIGQSESGGSAAGDSG
jgi:histidinol-phosphate aminotransferase